MHKLAPLGVSLTDFTEGGIMVTNWDESSLVVEVIEKQDQELISFYVKANIHKQRVLAFELGEIVC